VSDKVSKHLTEISESVNNLNFYLRDMSDHIHEIAHGASTTKYLLQAFLPDPSLTLSSLIPELNENLKSFDEDLKSITL
jgi:hypothetical protein